MQGRLYSASLQNVTISAVQDLFSMAIPNNRIVAITRINLGQIGATAVGNLRVRIRKFGATITVGTGGVTLPATPVVAGDAAAGVTIRGQDTTTQMTGVAGLDLYSDAWPVPGSWLYLPTDIRRLITSKISEGFSISLDTAPSPSFVGNLGIEWEEVGG